VVRFRAQTDSELWEEVQRLLLRLPPAPANAWRQEAARAARAAGAEEDAAPDAADVLPGVSDEAVYPGLKGSVKAPGLRLSSSAPLPEALGVVAVDEALRPLACAAALGLYFLDRDPLLHHALRSVQAFGVNPLTNADQARRCRGELVRRFRRAADGAALGPADFLRAAIDLDEAVHSLVYVPPVDREQSWWGRAQQAARKALDAAVERARQAGVSVQVLALWGPYADVNDRSSHDLELDGGTVPPGEVSACLRVYARIAGEVSPGRVLYRSVRSGR
jgi:hypothetical protein